MSADGRAYDLPILPLVPAVRLSCGAGHATMNTSSRPRLRSCGRRVPIMKYLVCLGLLASLLFIGAPSPAAPPTGKDNLADQVRKSIEEGKKFLRAQQVDV